MEKMHTPINPTPRRHVIISGTGRAGTSFLVQLLTKLGLNTGFTESTLVLDEVARAGLEHDVRKEGAPYVVKSPFFCDHAAEVLLRKDILLEHVFIPFRDLHAAAESRRFVIKSAISRMPLLKRLKGQIKNPKVPGGLFNTKVGRNQEKALLLQVYKLLLALSEAHIPITLLQYPKLVKDTDYLYAKLQPILGTISYDNFCKVFARTVRPEWTHDFTKK